jgi:hypothetical protein
MAEPIAASFSKTLLAEVELLLGSDALEAQERKHPFHT